MIKKAIRVGILGTAAVATALAAQALLNKTSYKTERVVDGDTFVTTENQMIRLAGINAPELENCDGPEAKKALEKLISNKKLYLKVIYRDSSNRLISDVYNIKGPVSTQMVRVGMAYYTQGGINRQKLNDASNTARSKKLGVHSPKCTQAVNVQNPKCVIKANIRMGSQEKFYHFPGCGQYNNTLVQLSLGDKWFCTESEAIKAGFTKGSDCFNQQFR